MSQPSPILQALLTSLSGSTHGNVLVLDQSTLGANRAAPLLELFTNQLGITTFTLNAAQLPAAVTGDLLTISGTGQGMTLTLTFQDLQGEVAIQALFQAAQISALQTAFTALPADFFNGIVVTAATATASVTVPGLGAALSFTQPLYGVAGTVTPSSGLLTAAVAPRVDGQVSPHGSPKPLYVELETPVSGFVIAPLAGGWTFTDFGWLLTGINILQAFPAIIPVTNLGLNDFALNLYPQAPDLSSVSLDVADINNPTQPLWSAVGGKVQLTDVNVIIGLTYTAPATLGLAGTGSVQGNFLLRKSLALQVEIPFPLSGVWSITAYPNLQLNVLDDIATLLDDSGQLAALMPANLAALGAFEFTYLRIAVDAQHFKLVEFTMSLGSTNVWQLIPNVVELTALRMTMTIDGTPAICGSVMGAIQIPGGSQIVVSFGRSSPQFPWRLDVVSPAIALPSLGDLAQLVQGVSVGDLVQAGGLDLLRFVMTNVNFGMTIAPTALTNLGLTLQLANSTTPTNPALDWELIPGVLTLTQFSFGFQLQWNSQDPTKNTKNAFGKFVLNGLEFDITFAEQSKQGTQTDALIAEYSAQGTAGTVDIKQLINAISPTVAAYVPDGLVINIADALLVYLGAGASKKYVFAMDISVEFPLSDLPLIGKSLPADAKAGLKNLKVVVASDALSPDDVTFINSLSPKPVLPTPPAGATGDAIPKGFSMLAEIELGSLTLLLTSPPAQKQQAAHGLLAAPAPDPVMWINVQKTFGPVAIQKVGFSYSGGSLFVLSNLAITVGGLELDLIGIGIGSPIKNPSPQFTIQGLSVSFQEGPVSVMGGMLGTLQPVDFTGALSVRTPEFTLAALAGYAEYQDHPSFFLYGVLNAPLGGPPAFFITGVAAGLGFNRKLVIPDVSGVATFPLVAWAQGSGTPSMDPTKPIGDQVAAVVSLLAQSGVVAPSVGDYWFAAGLQFTSFELLNSFALLTLTVGTDVEIALLGLSTLTLPPDVSTPVAEVQLALEVAFSFSSGLLAIAAQLTSNSYVLDPACRLTGGFAFYTWFSGEHCGETILTLGGYNPNFTVPDYYPAVPRLGLNWQVVPGVLSITGGLYFAVTSNAIMAGGKLGAVWNSGPISAWFSYWADFLMTFQPFHYYIDGGIDLGASFTVDLLFFSISVTIHVGVGLELWGPPFAGRATVDLSIISFTITFNDHAPDPQTAIPWSQFVQQLLPQQSATGQHVARRGRLQKQAALDGGAPPTEAAVVQINIIGGLIRALAPTADGPCYLVNAEQFQCAVLTVIPSKDVAFETDPGKSGFVNLSWAPDAAQPQDPSGQPIVPNVDFGVGPANISSQDFQPQLTLSVNSESDSIFQAVRRLSNAPKALWEQKTFDANGVPQVNPATGLTESTIPNALVGLTLVPFVTPPDHTLPVPLDSLLFTLDGQEPFAWSPGIAPATSPFTSETVAATIGTPAVTSVRAALLGACAGQGVVVATTVDVSTLANPATNDLQAAPRLRLLGDPTPAN